MVVLNLVHTAVVKMIVFFSITDTLASCILLSHGSVLWLETDYRRLSQLHIHLINHDIISSIPDFIFWLLLRSFNFLQMFLLMSKWVLPEEEAYFAHNVTFDLSLYSDQSSIALVNLGHVPLYLRFICPIGDPVIGLWVVCLLYSCTWRWFQMGISATLHLIWILTSDSESGPKTTPRMYKVKMRKIYDHGHHAEHFGTRYLHRVEHCIALAGKWLLSWGAIICSVGARWYSKHVNRTTIAPI